MFIQVLQFVRRENNNNNNNTNKLQLGFHPVSVVILHVYGV